MKTKVMTVTPKMAAAWIEKTTQLVGEGKFRQRPINNETVDQYCRAMRDGKWVLTHQGVGIGENGAILDGQHRLEAVARCGLPIQMQVTFDMPIVGSQNGYTMMTIDAIDRGRSRGIGQNLQIGHGILNGNNVAAVCRSLAVAFTGLTNIKLSVTDTMAIYTIYNAEIEMLRLTDKSWRNNASVAAVLCMGIVAGTPGIDFMRSYLMGDHRHDDPANILKRWLNNNTFKKGGNHLHIMGGSAYCVKAHFESRSLTKGFASHESLAWLIDRQGKRSSKVRSLFEIAQ